MKDRPILFQGAMVRALLDGSKTQTRRICKSEPYPNGYKWDGQDFLCHNDYLPPSAMLMDYNDGKEIYTTSNMEGWDFCCPYGQPGDRLWVRESFMDLTNTGVEHHDSSGKRRRYAYMADSPTGSYGDEARKGYGLKWKPSIHMPRAACRIELEIVAVRVERLNDCSQADAIAEGAVHIRSKEWDRENFPVWRYLFDEAVSAGTKPPVGPSSKQAYEALWESINGAGSWAANPWVWVVEFKRAQPC